MLFLIIFILSFAGSFFLPWWVAAIVAFLAAFFIEKTPSHCFLEGFAAVFVVWTILALVKSLPNDNILAGRVVQLFPLPHSWIWVVLVAALVGGLVGGMAALSGGLLKKAFSK